MAANLEIGTVRRQHIDFVTNRSLRRTRGLLNLKCSVRVNLEIVAKRHVGARSWVVSQSFAIALHVCLKTNLRGRLVVKRPVLGFI